MTRVLGENISNSEVVGSDGTTIGRVEDVTMNLETGALDAIVVSPTEQTPKSRVSFPKTEEGYFRVPVEAFSSKGDRIVVNH